jgi:oxygen-independent coproporphyrinogen III oxidase
LQSSNQKKTDARAAGLYIHVPFCASKCPYCDFFSIASADMIDAWCAAVCRELDLYCARFDSFETLYFGGGTPSLLSTQQLGSLMEHVRARVHVAADAECTIEVNPDDLSREKACALHDLGFNRLSIGVQSFDDRMLRFLQRRHTARQARNAFAHAAAAGFDTISLDLMYGLPEQNWQVELKQALGMQPAHLSCYQLTIKPGTLFYSMKQEGRLSPESEETLAQLFLLTDSLLTEAGYDHYEVSNYARSPGQDARHNSRYWQHLPYLGLGPAAHSFAGQKRWWNVDSVPDYCRLIAGGRSPAAGEETLSQDQLRLERLMLGLRTRRGVVCEDVRAGKSTLARLEREGLIVLSPDRIVPTVRGMLFSDQLPLLLEDGFEQSA